MRMGRWCCLWYVCDTIALFVRTIEIADYLDDYNKSFFRCIILISLKKQRKLHAFASPHLRFFPPFDGSIWLYSYIFPNIAFQTDFPFNWIIITHKTFMLDFMHCFIVHRVQCAQCTLTPTPLSHFLCKFGSYCILCMLSNYFFLWTFLLLFCAPFISLISWYKYWTMADWSHRNE